MTRTGLARSLSGQRCGRTGPGQEVALVDIALWIVLGILTALVALGAFVGAQFLTRGTPIERLRALERDRTAPTAAQEEFRRMVETHVSTELTRGNRVEILSNGEEVYPRLFEDLRSARDLITWHVFWFKPGRLADELEEILLERARAGVEVLFLYDWFGTRGVDEAYFRKLKDGGVEVACFRPPRPTTLYKVQQRSHARTVVVDGRIGYTGGFAIHDDWMGDGRHEGQWRDTSARLEGPAVYQLQAGFIDDWAEATRQLLVGDRVFPEGDARPGDTHAGVFFSAPALGATRAEQYFALSIAGSSETLYITNAYFVPDDDFRRMLVDAVGRGVDVRVLTPGGNTDRPSTWYAARCHYEALLEGGVRIYEYRPTMVHAKTLVADRMWSSVGTMNFDNRSMALNDEVTLLCHDPRVGRRLHDRFLQDIELADELELDAFRRRGAWERAQERAWVVASRLL
ncbi:MAG: hypothetical protein KY453_00495 [Gemmatimonadetes bacterium]|nr:hypothetical protein [Gemmatimonadota bacterium]